MTVSQSENSGTLGRYIVTYRHSFRHHIETYRDSFTGHHVASYRSGFEVDGMSNLTRRVEQLEQDQRQRVDAVEARMFAAVRGTPGMDALAALGAWGLLGAEPEPMSDGARAVCTMGPAALYGLFAGAVITSAAAVSDSERALCGFADLATLKRDLERYRDTMIAEIAKCQARGLA